MFIEYAQQMAALSAEFLANGDQEHLKLLPLLGMKANAAFFGRKLSIKPDDYTYLPHDFLNCDVCEIVNNSLIKALKS